MLAATRSTVASVSAKSPSVATRATVMPYVGGKYSSMLPSSSRAMSTRATAAQRKRHDDRYLIIHSFFTRIGRETAQSALKRHPSKSRLLSTSLPRHKQYPDDHDENFGYSEWRKLQEKSRNDRHSPSHKDQPFHNYPRSLRELALQARARGAPSKLQNEHLDDQVRDRTQHRTASNDEAKLLQDYVENAQDKAFSSSAASSSSGQDDKKAAQPPSRWTRPRPPSKEELLQIAQGFWTRLRIRFKWFTIRGFRRFNADDISAFFTLGGLGTVLFIIVGTTTAVSLFFAALNVLNMQEWIARKLADYLTAETGVTVIFESAIVPKWKDSRICFQNVFISRRAYLNDSESLRQERGLTKSGKRKRRGTATTAGQGMAWEGTHFNEYDDEEVASPMSARVRGQEEDQTDGRNINFSMFDLNVDSIDVKLSFKRWWDGKGLVEDAVVEGVRGIVDRRNVVWDPDTPYNPRAARRKHKHGDFELDSLTVKDFLVTVYQPSDFRPFNLSIFEAQMPRLRRQWLFYDLLGADRITGQVDGCLFSLHKPQSIGRTSGREREIQTGRWKTLSRLRIDGINFDHIQNQSDVHGPVSWILSGKFDVVADIKLPKEASSDIDINVIITEMIDHLTQAVSSNDARSEGPIPGQHRLSGPAIEAPVTTVGPASEGAWKQKQKEEEEVRLLKAKRNGSAGGWRNEMELAGREASRRRSSVSMEVEEETTDAASTALDQAAGSQSTSLNPELTASEDKDHVSDAQAALEEEVIKETLPSTTLVPNAASVIIDLDVRFKDIKAAVPLFTSDLTYRTQTFVRPIVAFMNANHTLIPVHCRVVMDLSEFDGSMDLAQTGLLPIISDKIYEALANHVQSQAANTRRMRNVSHWWLQLASDQALQYAKLVRDTLARNKGTHSTSTASSSSSSMEKGRTSAAQLNFALDQPKHSKERQEQEHQD